jgi:hypothetical protein
MDLLLILVPIVLVLLSQGIVNSTYNKYKLYKSKNNITGFDAARTILDSNGLKDVKIVEVSGELSDHFDPRKNVIRLSKDVYRGTSIASVAVAAHECGHAIQYKKKYTPIIIRGFLVPVVSFASQIGYIMLVIGLLAELLNLAYIGLILMAGSLVFQLVTLPVELNASKRAKEILIKENLIKDDEKDKVSGMLNAAAFTYIASFFATLLQLLRLLLIVSRRDD